MRPAVLKGPLIATDAKAIATRATGTPAKKTALQPNPLTALIIDDALGFFGGATNTPSGGIGNPSFTAILSFPPGTLAGLNFNLSGIGYDPADPASYFGFFRMGTINVNL